MKKVLLFIAIVLGAVSTSAQTDTLKISILGDSYSTFYGYLANDTNEVWYFPAGNEKHIGLNDVSKVEETWWYQVVEQMGAKLELNQSFSGAPIAYCGYMKDVVNSGHVTVAGLEQFADYSNRSFVNRTNKLGEPDVILVCGATNDSWIGTPMGDYVYGNQTFEQLHYFRPAMAKMLSDIKVNYPGAKVLFILNSELRPSINESVHTICKHYGVQCLDLHDIDKQAGHPSAKGMKDFASQVVEKLRTM